MKNIISPVDWFKAVEERSKDYIKDKNDMELLTPETYGLVRFMDAHIESQGIYGDYVTVEAFQLLANRFIIAMELISVMEQNQDIDNL